MKLSMLVPVALSAAVLLVSSACKPPAKPAKEDTPPSPKVSDNASATKPPVVGYADAAPAAVKTAMTLPELGPAPSWRLRDLDGNVVTSDQFKGKVVVVDFWATWCPPCRVEIPGYVELQEKYGDDGFVIVGVSLDQQGPSVVKAFANANGINYPLVMGDEAVVSAFGGVEGIPTTFLIDRAGKIRDRKVGAEHTAEYEKKVLAVLEEKV